MRFFWAMNSLFCSCIANRKKSFFIWSISFDNNEYTKPCCFPTYLNSFVELVISLKKTIYFQFHIYLFTEIVSLYLQNQYFFSRNTQMTYQSGIRPYNHDSSSIWNKLIRNIFYRFILIKMEIPITDKFPIQNITWSDRLQKCQD